MQILTLTFPYVLLNWLTTFIIYILFISASQNSLCVTTHITEVPVERIDGSLGITLRGGYAPDHPHLSRPLVITHVRPNGPAHR